MAYILLEMAYQRRKMHSFMVRPDLRLEEGDELYYNTSDRVQYSG